jgi:hypothetical protein
MVNRSTLGLLVLVLGCSKTTSPGTSVHATDADASTPCSSGQCLDGTGAFEEVRLETGAGLGISPIWAKFGDLDGDGFLDLAVTSSHGVDSELQLSTLLTTLHGDGHGGFEKARGPFEFTTGSLEPVVGRFDADLRSDVLMGGAVGISDSDGGLQRLIAMEFRNGSYFWGSIDGDDYTDFVVISDSVLVGVGRGDGTFDGPFESQQNVLYLDHVKVIDIDGDGASDLIGVFDPNVGDSRENGATNMFVRVLLGDGTGHFGAPQDLEVAEGVDHFDVADFNNDGSKDIVLARKDGVIDLRLRRREGWQTARILVAGDSNHRGAPVVVADVDGDGKADIVRFDEGSQQLVALVGVGDGSFLARSPFLSTLPRLNPYSLAAADVNGDGKDDIVAVDTQFEGQIALWLSHH